MLARAARAGIEPVAVDGGAGVEWPPACADLLEARPRGQARLAISALFGIARVKHVFVVDDDVDMFSDEEIEWAMSARFSADRDLVTIGGFAGFYMDPTAGEDGTVTKAGFDLTASYDRPERSRRDGRARPTSPARRRASKPCATRSRRGRKLFMQIMQALGSKDGREIALELDALAQKGNLGRLANGEWALAPPPRK